jgi:hypothetical protein
LSNVKKGENLILAFCLDDVLRKTSMGMTLSEYLKRNSISNDANFDAE